jgi:hypothetical protein
MILGDTNLFSQLTRAAGDKPAVDWLDARGDDLWMPAIVVAELLSGGHRHHDPAQRSRLLARTDALLARMMGRVLPYEDADARRHGELAGNLARQGVALSVPDGMIAAMGLTRGATVATRNTKDFERTGVQVVNPWTSAAA